MRKIAIIICVISIIVFILGATTGTIEGYQGANGQYYSNPGAKGSNEWMCTPALVVAIISGFIVVAAKNE